MPIAADLWVGTTDRLLGQWLLSLSRDLRTAKAKSERPGGGKGGRKGVWHEIRVVRNKERTLMAGSPYP